MELKKRNMKRSQSMEVLHHKNDTTIVRPPLKKTVSPIKPGNVQTIKTLLPKRSELELPIFQKSSRKSRLWKGLVELGKTFAQDFSIQDSDYVQEENTPLKVDRILVYRMIIAPVNFENVRFWYNRGRSSSVSQPYCSSQIAFSTHCL